MHQKLATESEHMFFIGCNEEAHRNTIPKTARVLIHPTTVSNC